MSVYAPRQPEWRGLDVPAVARRIREGRVAAGLSQRQLAFPGCSAAYVSRLEAGQRVPSAHLLEELARRMGTTRGWIETGEHVCVIAIPQAIVDDALQAHRASLDVDADDTAVELSAAVTRTQTALHEAVWAALLPPAVVT